MYGSCIKVDFSVFKQANCPAKCHVDASIRWPKFTSVTNQRLTAHGVTLLHLSLAPIRESNIWAYYCNSGRIHA